MKAMMKTTKEVIFKFHFFITFEFVLLSASLKRKSHSRCIGPILQIHTISLPNCFKTWKLQFSRVNKLPGTCMVYNSFSVV